MNTIIKQTFTFQEAKAIFNLLSNTVTMQVFFDSGTANDRNKISVVAHSINAIQAAMFLAAIDTECSVQIVSVSDSFEFTLALNAAMNKTTELKPIAYTKEQETEMWKEEQERRYKEYSENLLDISRRLSQ